MWILFGYVSAETEMIYDCLRAVLLHFCGKLGFNASGIRAKIT